MEAGGRLASVLMSWSGAWSLEPPRRNKVVKFSEFFTLITGTIVRTYSLLVVGLTGRPCRSAKLPNASVERVMHVQYLAYQRVPNVGMHALQPMHFACWNLHRTLVLYRTRAVPAPDVHADDGKGSYSMLLEYVVPGKYRWLIDQCVGTM
jgi:hypothetical protein